MEINGFDPLLAIADHSAAIALAADGNLDANVAHCPGWTVLDLVQHLVEVHWFWATIVDERLSEPPGEDRRPEPPPRESAIEVFRERSERLVSVLSAADPADSLWTWAPAQQDVAFVIRHQVQEAAVHHWDATDAGGSLEIAAPVAADAVDEFLRFSVSNDADPADPPRPALDGSFSLRCTDFEAGWTISDGSAPGNTEVLAASDAATDVAVSGTASQLLLWLYGRVELDVSAVPTDLIERFKALCFTD